MKPVELTNPQLMARPDPFSVALSDRLIGQRDAIEAIAPFLQMHQAGLAPDGRPVGVFLLLGPTGTGKTKTVESVADVLHGSAKKMLKVDCGEFQMEHEVAKLLGAPPGYLGHRETQPLLSQASLNSVTSEESRLSVVLFDEIEKAATSMTRLLLGILDKATLRLGDNTSVNFEESIIFLTSNVGARSMQQELLQGFGFGGMTREQDGTKRKLQSIAVRAARQKFSPEFMNRIDAVITYQPLNAETMSRILDQQIECVQQHLNRRLGDRTFELEVSARSRKFLLKTGSSVEFGARELKRTLQREIVQPIAAMLSEGLIEPGGTLRSEMHDGKNKLVMRAGYPERLRLAS